MKKVIRLTESDLVRIVKRVIIEESNKNDLSQCRTELDNIFKESKTWLTNWISSEQFRKKIGIGQPHIISNNNDSKIKNWLGKIPKIKYTISVSNDVSKNTIGWYDHSKPETIFLNKQNVNCNSIKNNKEVLKSFIVHEMVHCLEKEIGWIGNASVTDKIQNIRPEFSNVDKYIISNRNETVAYIYGSRTFLNLQPNQEITDTMIVNKLNGLQKSVKFSVSDDREKFGKKFFSLSDEDEKKFPNLNVLLFKFFVSNKNYLHEFLNDVNLLAKNNKNDDYGNFV
jgi:hypothetical protein